MTEDKRSLVAPELAAALDFFPRLDLSQGVSAYRLPMDASLFPPPPPELAVVAREERLVPGPAGAPQVRVLVYTPPAAVAQRPALLHLHGGGFVLGAPDMNDTANRGLALALGITVVSVDYRLAPETVWPGALEDCYAVLAWMHDNAAQLGIDPARIAASGESAGGGHAAALALYARDRARDGARESAAAPRLAFLLLDSPMIDDRSAGKDDPHPYCGDFVWTRETNAYGWSALLGVTAGSAEVPAAAVPARAEDLTGLPPTFVSVGALDLFLEEDMDFVRRLSRAGVPVELHVIPGAYHGFGLAQGAPQVTLVEELRRKALARGLGVAYG